MLVICRQLFFLVGCRVFRVGIGWNLWVICLLLVFACWLFVGKKTKSKVKTYPLRTLGPRTCNPKGGLVGGGSSAQEVDGTLSEATHRARLPELQSHCDDPIRKP